MHDLARPNAKPGSVTACNIVALASDKPNAPIPPTSRKSRRVSPSQSFFLVPSMRSTMTLLQRSDDLILLAVRFVH